MPARSIDPLPPALAPSRPGWAEWAVLLAVLLLAVVLRAYRLDAKSLWLDELMMARAAAGDGTLLGPFGGASSGHPVGYLFLLRLFLFVERGDGWLRLPALIASAGGVVAMWALGRVLLGRTVGLLAAFLLATSAYHLSYGQEVHSYALFATLSTLMLWALCRVARQVSLEERQPEADLPPEGAAGRFLRTWGWFILFSTFNLYIHYFAIFAVAVAALAFPLLVLDAAGGSVDSLRHSPLRRRFLRDLALALLVIALLYLPQLAFGLLPGLHRAGTAVQATFTGETEARFQINLDTLADVFLDFAAGKNRADMPLWIAFGTLVPVLLGAAWLARWRLRLAVALFIWSVVPLLPIALFAQRMGFSFASRRLLFIFPVVILLVAIGLPVLPGLAGRLWRRISGQSARPVAVALTLLLLFLFSLGSRERILAHYRTPKQDWETLAAILKTQAGSEDSVLVHVNAADNLAWYYDGPQAVVAEGLSAASQRACARGHDVFVAVALTGPRLPAEEGAWLQENFVEVPLHLLRLYYRNCRPQVWYGDGALPVFDMADHPESLFELTRQARQAFLQEAARAGGAASPPLEPLTGPPAEAASPGDAAERARQAEIERLAALAATAPDDRAVQHAYGRALLDGGRPAAALPIFQALVDSDPADRPAHLALAETLASLGRHEDAIARYQAIHDRWPDFPWAYVHRGQLLEKLGRVDEAITAYETALQGSPEEATLHFLLAYALIKAGRADEAILAFERGLALDPERAAARARLQALRAESETQP